MVTLQYGKQKQVQLRKVRATHLTCHIALWRASTFSTLRGSLNDGQVLSAFICVDEGHKETWVELVAPHNIAAALRHGRSSKEHAENTCTACM
jgi:hypothetical protein